VPSDAWLDEISWGPDGLIPAVTQDTTSGKVLTLAWMNREALRLTLSEGRAIYWSRSRKKIWRKGEESGHVQKLRSLRLDCDKDSVLLLVDSVGGIACHTGRETCFFLSPEDGTWKAADPVIKLPDEIYSKD
jgi:phosphoribosyl-AMP cyclohydrolase